MLDKIQTIFLKKHWLFLLLFSGLAALYYDGVLDKSPLNSHIWRQTDCLSLTKHYQEGAPFLEPEMHIQLGDKGHSGKTAGEFPILYYLVGQIWKISGESFLVFRLVYLAILFFGVFCLYRSILLVFDSYFWAITLALLLFTSPVFITFGVSFLTDIPAFCFVLVALYFMTQYGIQRNQKWLLLALGFFALAGLIKVSSLTAFFAVCFLFLIELFGFKSLGYRKLFQQKWTEWLSFAGTLVAILLWYVYAHFYNIEHGFKYTFNDIYPLWLLAPGELDIIIERFLKFTSIIFFSRPILILIPLLGVFNLFLWKKIPLAAYWGNIMILLGSIFYVVLWAPLLGNHDYYFGSLLILFIGTFVPFAFYLHNNHSSGKKGIIIQCLAAIFLLYNIGYANEIVEFKTLKMTKESTFCPREEFIEHMTYTNWFNRHSEMRYLKVRPIIDSLGIAKTDLVIALPDLSFNASLYLLDRKGWTNFMNYHSEEEINKLISLGAKYLFIGDENTLQQSFLKEFTQNEIYDFEGLKIFQLPKSPIALTPMEQE